MNTKQLLSCGLATLALLGGANVTHAATVSFATPTFDKWMYPNVDGSTGGSADVAPTFANLDSPDEEDRLGNYLASFTTSSKITAGLSPAAYAITSVKLKLSVLTGNTFLYDATHDTYQTYLAASDPLRQPDSDAGRPVELFGVGLRNGYTALSAGASGTLPLFSENSAYGTQNAPTFRNAFPLAVNPGGSLFDAADNISQKLEATPFAVGTAALASGASVPELTTFTFELQLSNAAILSYLQGSLSSGVLGFFVSSLHISEGQGGSQIYPRFITREGAFFLGEAQYEPQLEITYTLVPEPSVTLNLLLGLGLVTAGRAFHRRRFFS